MKFICKKCMNEKLSDDPCILNLKGSKHLKWDRENWREALRRCPFENDSNGTFNGKVPLADWVRMK
jgi:hypothetical protein